MNEPVPPTREDSAATPPAATEQAWVDLLRAALPHLERQAFARLQPVRVEHAGGRATLRIQPAQEVKRALAPWMRRFGTTVPVHTSLDADATDLLRAPAEAAAWLGERPLLCCAVPVLDDLLIAARAMAAEGAGGAVARAAQDLGFAAAELVVGACEPWPDARLPWSDPKNRPTLRLVAQAIDLALRAQDHERALGWMQWMLARDPEDPHGWRAAVQALRGAA